MDGVDATDRQIVVASTPPQSLLVIIIDTNPIAWSELSDTLPLSKALAHLQVFINAHLAISHGNQVAVIASHVDRAQWLYPTPTKPAKEADGEHLHNGGAATHTSNGTDTPKEEQGKYRPFLVVEQQLRNNLQSLLKTTTVDSLSSAESSTQIAGALTTALTYINKRALLASPTADSDPTTAGSAPLPGAVQPDGTTSTKADGSSAPLVARILILSVSGDLSAQYISVMNAIFAAQRRHVPIDVLKLAGDPGFLQQACDATAGVYLEPDRAALGAPGSGLLQYLMMAYLPDATARRALVPPGRAEVDFRAACFCHRRVVDLGFVCSVCLSIFCEPLPDSVCLTCGTTLDLPASFGVKPAVLPRRRKKKKQRAGDGSPAVNPAPS